MGAARDSGGPATEPGDRGATGGTDPSPPPNRDHAAGDPGRAHEGPPPVPWITLLLMALFLVGGSLGLLVDWPAGPAHVNWGVWLLVYGGYLYVAAAALFYVRTGK